MVNFELALRNDLSSTIQSAQVDGCVFYICQAVMRAFRRLGYKEGYKRVHTDPTSGQKNYTSTRIWIRRLMLLACIPTEDVTDAFFRILNPFPVSDEPNFLQSPGTPTSERSNVHKDFWVLTMLIDHYK